MSGAQLDENSADASRATSAQSSSSSSADAVVELEAGARLGRYLALARLGSGGMGVVWAAWDPKLDREVAIKLLSHKLTGTRARDRLLREAQALARLPHPNIVSVHDVGVVGGQVFVAMEYIRGQTLRQFCRERPWAAIVDAYRQAALGLAAAHKAGLAHRDFKPDNAMIDEDGRVRVMDFGLAAAYGYEDDAAEAWPSDELQADAHAPSDDPEDAPDGADRPRDRPLDRGSSDLLSTPLTEVGAVIGTPAFMAPEQLEGRGGGPASDQFALCVALWHGLFGQRPYPGETINELLASMRARKLRAPPPKSEVPPAIVAALTRGLSLEPARRFATMSELAQALEPPAPPAGLRRTWVGVGLVLAALAGAGLAWRASLRAHARTCDEVGAPLAATWSPSRRASLAEQLEASGSHGEAMWARVEPALDEWTSSWIEVAGSGCRGSDGLPEALAVARAVCLERGRGTLEATLELLDQADAQIAARALDMVAALPDPARCSDPEHLAVLDRQAVDTPSEANALEAKAIRAGLDRAHALAEAGLSREVLAVLEPLRPRAEALGQRQLHGQLLTLIGQAQRVLDRNAEAVASLDAAYAELLHSGDDLGAGEAAVALVAAHTRLARVEAAEVWDVQARVLLERGDAGVELRATRLIALASLADSQGQFREALASFEDAAELLETKLGPESLALGRMLDDLGAVHSRLNQLEQAEAAEARALAILEAGLGAAHPEVGNAHFKLGNTNYRKSDIAAARTHFEQAIAIVEPALGPNTSAVTGSLTGLGALALAEGDQAEAARRFRAALERIEAERGTDSPDLVPPLVNLGVALKRGQDYVGAEAVQLRALDLLEAARGPEHPDLIAVLDNLGELRLLRGEPAGAREVYLRSLAIGEARFGVGHPELDYAQLGLADAAQALGELDEATRRYQLVVAQPEREGKNQALVADAQAKLDALAGAISKLR